MRAAFVLAAALALGCGEKKEPSPSPSGEPAKQQREGGDHSGGGQGTGGGKGGGGGKHTGGGKGGGAVDRPTQEACLALLEKRVSFEPDEAARDAMRKASATYMGECITRMSRKQVECGLAATDKAGVGLCLSQPTQ
jgi:hypothetical protein